MIACIGIRPFATSWPPARRTAEPNGAAHVFSQTSAAATLPGSIAAARWAMSSSARISASSASSLRRSPSSWEVVELHRLDVAVLVLLEDQEIEHADQFDIGEPGELGGDLAGEIRLARRELDHDKVDRPKLIKLGCSHRSSLRARQRRALLSRFETQ